MSYTANGIIRDYDTAADTATVELTGIGVVDTWLDGVAVNVSLNRAFLVSGAACVISLPDAHRFCEAQVTAVTPPFASGSSGGTLPDRADAGKVGVTLDGTGAAAFNVPFHFTFTNPPQVAAGAQGVGAVTVTAVTTTNFHVNLAGGHINGSCLLTWTAHGP